MPLIFYCDYCRQNLDVDDIPDFVEFCIDCNKYACRECDEANFDEDSLYFSRCIACNDEQNKKLGIKKL